MDSVPNPVEQLRDRMSRPLVRFDHSELGASAVGTVVELAEGDGEFGSFPIVTIDTGSELVSIVCARSVLRREVLGRDIRIGDAFAIEYLGEDKTAKGTKFHNYRVGHVASDRKPEPPRIPSLHDDEPPVDEPF